MSKQLKQATDLVILMNSAKEQFEDDVIDQDEFIQRINKYIADYRSGLEIGNRSSLMPFGDHKDEKVDDLPTRYIKYLLDQDWFVEKFAKLRTELEAVLISRGEMD